MDKIMFLFLFIPNIIFNIWTEKHLFNLFMPKFFGIPSITTIQIVVLGFIIGIVGGNFRTMYKKVEILEDEKTKYKALIVYPVLLNLIALGIGHFMYWVLV